MKTKILTLTIVVTSIFSSCAKEKKAGGCTKCMCNAYSDTNNDGKCDTIKNTSKNKCLHPENEHM
ncbi:hypothetical protein [Chryseobacterium schmidteae]|uniref:hypothetical protein n=1 Tax=Chryseobacterium schmidteae TaxID=2730404 RepID=UPI00158D3EC2|nr:hypothetical protein [Chryseobacterium schmidteae]